MIRSKSMASIRRLLLHFGLALLLSAAAADAGAASASEFKTYREELRTFRKRLIAVMEASRAKIVEAARLADIVNTAELALDLLEVSVLGRQHIRDRNAHLTLLVAFRRAATVAERNVEDAKYWVEHSQAPVIRRMALELKELTDNLRKFSEAEEAIPMAP